MLLLQPVAAGESVERRSTMDIDKEKARNNVEQAKYLTDIYLRSLNISDMSYEEFFYKYIETYASFIALCERATPAADS